MYLFVISNYIPTEISRKMFKQSCMNSWNSEKMQVMKNTFKIISVLNTKKKLQQDKVCIVVWNCLLFVLTCYPYTSEKAGTHNSEWATLLYPCNGVFTEQLIFRSISLRIILIIDQVLQIFPEKSETRKIVFLMFW